MTCLERNIQLSLIKTVSITSTDSVIIRTTEKQIYMRFIGLFKISNWSLFKLIISEQALITLKWFCCLIYVQFNGQKFSGLFQFTVF